MLDRQLAIDLFSNIEGCSIEFSDTLASIELGRPKPIERLTQSQLIKRFFSRDVLINVNFPIKTNSRSQSYLYIFSREISINTLVSAANNINVLDKLALLKLEDSYTYPGLFYLAQSSNNLTSFVNSLKPGIYLALVLQNNLAPIIATVSKTRNMPIINPIEVEIDKTIRVKVNQWEFPFDYENLRDEIKQFMQYIVLDSNTNLSSQIPILI